MSVKPNAKLQHVKNAKNTKNANAIIIFGVLALLLFIIAMVLTFSRGQENQTSCAGKLNNNIKYNCYLSYALKSGNATICNELNSTYANDCILYVATNYSSVNDCNLIGNKTVKQNCISNLSILKNNPGYCSYLDANAYSQCIYNDAKAENFTNYALCNKITNSSQKNICLSTYYFKLTYSSGGNYCGYITNKPNYSVLYNMIYFTNQNITAINNAYQYTYYNITPYAYCVSYVAYISKNQNLCSTLNSSNNTLCKSAFTQKILNTSISNVKNECLNQNATLRSLCLYSIEIYTATTSKNVSECMQINNTMYQYSCISNIAQTYNDLNYCTYINNDSARYDCNLLIGNYS